MIPLLNMLENFQLLVHRNRVLPQEVDALGDIRDTVLDFDLFQPELVQYSVQLFPSTHTFVE